MPRRPSTSTIRPTRAIVLAAGFGSRLRPLTYECPKPLVPFWGRPVLSRTLAMLADWGVRDVLVNLHHGADALLRHLREPVHPVRINISFEPEILGTGGAIARAAWFFERAPLWVVNADIVADLDPTPLLEAYRARDPLAVLWMPAPRAR
jgi:MurNAc alpha-1-phosphate uridylyltransferase